MVRKPHAALAATLFVAATLGSAGAQTREPKLAPTVIVACDQGGQSDLVTRVSGSETAGRVPVSLTAALQAHPSCAVAFNLLARGGFDLVQRLAGDFEAHGDIDGRDFLVWQRGGNSPAPARPSARSTTVLLSCNYMVAADGSVSTMVAGSEIAGAIAVSLAAALASPPSCAVAYAALAGAGFGLVSAPAAAGVVDAADYTVWRDN